MTMNDACHADQQGALSPTRRWVERTRLGMPSLASDTHFLRKLMGLAKAQPILRATR
jgi:hypothetical protein